MSETVLEYKEALFKHKSCRLYLLEHSGLPGPRANIELAKAFAQTAGQRVINEYAALSPTEAPENTPEEFLAFCGILGLGRLVLEQKDTSLEKLRKAASDTRWRIREAVAMALQTIGHFDMDWLINIAREWAEENYFEQRAAVAGICEPELLWDKHKAPTVFDILDLVTLHIEEAKERSSEGFKVLRKGLAYCWSVAVAAYPDEGEKAMENWMSSSDGDVRWIMKQNLKKKRLQKMDAGWVAGMKKKI